MELYLLRHGSAALAGAGEPDSERALTEEGRQEVTRVVATAKLAHACPSLVITSPYKRAVETADIAAALLDCKMEILTSESLLPDADPAGVWHEIRAHQDESAILLAGHNPLFSALSAYLLGCPDLQVDFLKAGMMRIDIERFSPSPRGVLSWMLTPKLAL